MVIVQNQKVVSNDVIAHEYNIYILRQAVKKNIGFDSNVKYSIYRISSVK